MLVLDFETKRIEKGSDRSPLPVGLAIKVDDLEPVYLAWDHPCENNTTLDIAIETAAELVSQNDKVLFHNAKFDLRVLDEHLSIQVPIDKVEDSMFLAYLNNPREDSFALKYLAERYLDMPPDDQAEMNNWILANVKAATPKTVGEFIAFAPGELVGKYAKSDVSMTYNLYHYYVDLLGEEGFNV